VRIVGAELLELRIPLRDPFATSAGSREARQLLLVRLRGDEGGEGWGECVAGETPAYSYETTETARHLLSRYLLPAMLGREVLGPEEILAPVSWIRGHPMAKAAVEMAAWDLQAREQGIPLWELLGGEADPLDIGAVVGMQPDENALLRKVEEALESGYTQVKVKIAPGRDIAPMRAIRSRLPEAPLAVDANGAYSLADAALFLELDQLGLDLIEQPLAPGDLPGHAHLQEKLETPICLDESIVDRWDLALAIELGALRVASLKVGAAGGLAPARELQRICLEAGLPARCGGMLETGIGRAHALALATLPGFELPCELSNPARYFEKDLIDPGLTYQGGAFRPPEGPGIGVAPDPGRIRAFTVAHEGWGTLA
jgi:o-succinylbenzoate synthase